MSVQEPNFSLCVQIPNAMLEWIWAQSKNGRIPRDLLAHVLHKLFQTALLHIFKANKSVNAYKHGIDIDYINGIKILGMPCIFSWSADTPKKLVLFPTAVLFVEQT